ncbi:heavy-metal-associated domain-containing protein [Tomitella fengzijianii]|uniref:Heavy-metal-associated domain-containing protein n=1 Tax=Tomitella fengzijianii TaxID=2597660 RepID=A0A516WZI7_9ACTN|nr:heavy-metal-associated domain-containing protein [Tomitella fengzijianii]QDQ96215.1 heavy-metal-associated domain-containing protein [Tomitella fengzijianii]
MSTTEFSVTGMSCGHCEGAVREEVETLPGVEVVSVSAQDGKLVISSAQPVDDAAVISAVDEAGYQASRT